MPKTTRRLIAVVLPLGAVLVLGSLAACSARVSGESAAHVPSTGSASGVVVPNARPAM